jgi:uncharacterized protein involved in exopolysaccharide biosynthesis/Mrp family chromosome partitioning ATPase
MSIAEPPVEMIRPASLAAVAGGNGGVPDILRISDLMAALRRNWHRIALSMLTSLLLGVLYLLVATPKYTSSAQFFVDPRGRNTVDAQVVPSGLGADAVLMESQAKILQSQTVLDRVVRQEKLADDPEFTRTWVPSWVRGLARTVGLTGPERTDEESRRQNALNQLARVLGVRRTSNTYIIDAEITTEDPVKSARIMKAIADSYLSDQTTAKAEEARRLNSAIDGRLTELREAVRIAENRVEEHRRQAGLLTAEGNLVNEQQTTRLNTALVQAQATTADAQARFERIRRAIAQGGNADAIPEATGSLAIQNLRSLYARAAQREASLASRLRSGHPELADAQSQVAAVRTQIVAELQRIATATQSELQVAQQREAQLKKNLDESMTELSTKNQARIRQSELDREAAASRRVLEAYMARAKETKEQQTLYSPEARVISPAIVSNRPSRPNKPVILAASLLAGLGAGIVWSILAAERGGRTTPGHAPVAQPEPQSTRSDVHPLRRWRTTATEPGATTPRTRFAERPAPAPQSAPRSAPATSPSRRQRATALAPIATVPLLMPPSRGGFLRRPQPIDSPFPGFARVCETATTVGNTGVAPFWSSIFRIADHVITGTSGERTRTCLLLGARGGIGTSTTALAVALSEAHAGSRVLLVDANGTDGDLASVFADPVLRLPERDGVDAAGFAAITTRDSSSGLEFLAIPRVAAGARRRIRPAAVATAILDLAQRYDLVVVDGGVVGVEPLARLLGESVDRLIVLDGSDRNAAEIAATLRTTGLADGRSGGLVLSEAGARS